MTAAAVSMCCCFLSVAESCLVWLLLGQAGSAAPTNMAQALLHIASKTEGRPLEEQSAVDSGALAAQPTLFSFCCLTTCFKKMNQRDNMIGTTV